MSVRVRYAPSPTGSPHVGNIRTALFCYLLARKEGGSMAVRIEDTDRARAVEGCEDEILESLTWMGIDWDEGPDKGGPYAPYRQSERKESGIYQPIIDHMLAQGIVYKAFDTSAELDEMREFQQINKQPQGYFGGIWRDATQKQVSEAEASGVPFVLRLKMPRGKTIAFPDAIRGRVEFESDTVDDPVLIKADGMPTYHFAAMVDDHLMKTTHIIRGEEWISSAPKHVWLFEAMGWVPPIFVHVPVIKGKDGKKLSKRHGDTRCLDFRTAGYLPEALANFIALIGWAPGGDREVMSLSEMIEAFSLEGLQPSPGIFDIEKLNWINGHYIRSLAIGDLMLRLVELVAMPDQEAYWTHEDREINKFPSINLLKSAMAHDITYVEQCVLLEQERVTTLVDFGDACEFFFRDEVKFDETAVSKWKGQSHIVEMFEHIRNEVAKLGNMISAESCEKVVRDYAAYKEFEKLGPVVHPIRIALTGKSAGPGLFELMHVLGPERMVKRMMAAMAIFR
jgi:glutamyl-tRNA synthetase